MVSNMEQTLRKMYEDAKTEGMMEGFKEAEEKIVKNMISKNMG